MSPYRDKLIYRMHENINRAKMICRAICMAGHAPFAPHLFFTQFLDDTKPEERRMGILAGQEFLKVFDRGWYYPKKGEHGEVWLSAGMQSDIDAAEAAGIKVERGTIGGDL